MRIPDSALERIHRVVAVDVERVNGSMVTLTRDVVGGSAKRRELGAGEVEE